MRPARFFDFPALATVAAAAVAVIVAVPACSGGGGSGEKAATLVSGPIISDQAWTRAGSPYVVAGDVVVEEGATLTIEPGVDVRFRPAPAAADGEPHGRSIRVRGALVAVGTKRSPIRFQSEVRVSSDRDRWNQIRFEPGSRNAEFDGDSVAGGSRIEHAILQGAGNSAVYAERSAPYLARCRFRQNASLYDKGDEVLVDPGYNLDQRVKGGAVYAWRPDGPFRVVECEFTANLCDGMGGALAIVEAETPDVLVADSEFSRNVTTIGGHGGPKHERSGVAHGGGAIRLLGTAARIERSAFRMNVAEAGGAIHASYYSHFEASDCRFDRNEADELGAALFIAHFSDPRILRSAFTRNSVSNRTGDPAGGHGGGIAIIGNCSPVIEECSFVRNLSVRSGGAVSCDNLLRPAPHGTLAILRSTIDGNAKPGAAALYFSLYDFVEVSGCRIVNHGGRAIEVRTREQDVNVIAQGNWWGTTVREKIASSISNRPEGAGKAVVVFEPFETSP